MSSPSDKAERDKSPLADFSITQVVVAGLAAATSFALSSQIGIAGSAIGAVIGAVASATASQVYRKLIDTSKEKLRSFGEAGDGTSGADAQTASDGQAPVEETALWQPASLSGRVVIDGVAESGTPIAPREVRYAARAREQARIRRRVAVVGAVVGVVAVLAFALLTYVATQGEGIGQTAPKRPAVEEEATQDGSFPTAPADPAPSAPGETDSSGTQGEGTTSGSAGSSGAADGSASADESASSSSPAEGTTGSDAANGDGATSPDASGSSSSGSSGTGDGSAADSGGPADATTPSAS